MFQMLDSGIPTGKPMKTMEQMFCSVCVRVLVLIGFCLKLMNPDAML